MSIKDAYTTQEIMLLLSIVAVSTVTRRAEREGWQARTRVGRGGGNE